MGLRLPKNLQVHESAQTDKYSQEWYERRGNCLRLNFETRLVHSPPSQQVLKFADDNLAGIDLVAAVYITTDRS